MRKTSAIASIAVLSFLLAGVASAFGQPPAELQAPQGDFFMSEGSRRMPAAADRSDFDVMSRIVIASVPVDVKGGKVSAAKTMPTVYAIGAQRFSGDASLTLDGDYDKETGMLVGTVKFDWAHGFVHDNGSTGSAKGELAGTFRGQFAGGRVMMHYVLKGPIVTDVKWKNGTSDHGDRVTGENIDAVYAFTAYPPPVEEGDGKDSGARFSGMSGEVEMRLPGAAADDWHLVKLETVIPVGAYVRTQEESSAVIGFADMSTFVLKPGTTIVVAKPVGKDEKMRLISGDVWVNARKMLEDGSMEIEMDQAVAGIKGTTFAAGERDGVSVLKVIEGAVTLTSRKTGETRTVESGMTARAGGDGGIAVEPFDLAAEMDAWDQATPSDWASYDAAAAAWPAEAAPASAAASSAPATKGNGARAAAAVVIVAAVAAVAVFFAKKRKAS